MTSFPALSAAPILSTPESHIFEDPTPPVDISLLPRQTDEELIVRYEIDRTIREIREGGWRRIGLQFPDEMVRDAVRVYGFLKDGLIKAQAASTQEDRVAEPAQMKELEENMAKVSVESNKSVESKGNNNYKLCILADTSYGSCCVDEIAAEHVDAEMVVHYGRSCLSPTARLPVVYVFTTQYLDIKLACKAFEGTYGDKNTNVMLVADLPYQTHLAEIGRQLEGKGYTNVVIPNVAHNPASLVPNRSILESINDAKLLKQYAIFHIGQPPPALLLTLASRVSSIHIYDNESNQRAIPVSTTPTLRRRYALLTSLSTVSIFGILINTLSVKNYLHVVNHVQQLINTAGKKSYTFVVGKVNPAKVANFAEIGGWVVVGCWESSLIESRDFYKPLITPFELELALMKDKDRLWNDEWRSDFDAVLGKRMLPSDEQPEASTNSETYGAVKGDDLVDDEESEPPDFDLRTGRYVSHSRPMRSIKGIKSSTNTAQDISREQNTLIKREKGDVAQVGGVVSPGAEYLQSARSWKGLGSDYEIKYDEPGALVEEGRKGVARGYVVDEKREGSKG